MLPPAARRWRWAAALAVLVCIFVNYYWNAHPPSGLSTGQLSARYPTPLTPAGYAFSIWGVIFTGLALYAGWQLLPAQQRKTFPDAISRPLTVAVLATGAWTVAFSYELIPLTMGLMLLILGTLIIVYGRVRRLALARRASRRAVWPFSIFLGWISLATVLNLTFGLRTLGWETSPETSAIISGALVVVVVALGLSLARLFQDALYPLTLAWGLLGTWAAHRHEGWLGSLALAAAVGLAGAALWTAWRRQQALAAG